MPHSTAVRAGEAPRAYQQLCGSPSRRYVSQTPGHRPTSNTLGTADLAERVLKPDRRAAPHNGPPCGEVLAHRGQSQGVQAQ